MPNESAPKCPKCHRADAKPISTSDCFLQDPPLAGQRPISTVTIYLCPCGETFTSIVRYGSEPPDEASER